MSGSSTGILALGGVLIALGGLVAAFPRNPILQARDFRKRFGNIKDNTRSFGIVLILFGLMFIGLVLFVNI
jgi:hypothetical protein